MSDIAQEYLYPVTTRQRIENVVEALLFLLDEMEGDTDLDNGADAEPSVCGSGGDDRKHGTSDDKP